MDKPPYPYDVDDKLDEFVNTLKRVLEMEEEIASHKEIEDE